MQFPGIKTVVFDLDGTLYVNECFAEEINRAAYEYLGKLLKATPEATSQLVRKTRERLSRERGTQATLSSVCTELGGDIQEFHRSASMVLHPESCITRDNTIINIVTALANRFELVIYTNNNRHLTDRILEALGLSGLFRRIFTIEDFWKPKPDRAVLELILEMIGNGPAECLFVGDRYDVDLRVPAELGCSVLLVSEPRDLMKLETALDI